MALANSMQSLRALNGRAFTAGRAAPTSRPLQASGPRRTALVVQNIRVNNVEIPNSKRIVVSLQYIFGLGHTSAQTILKNTGLENKKTYELNEEEINKIREEVGKYTTEADLRRQVAQNIKRLKDIQCYRGKRHIMGLPLRGQRTKTNARTRKGKVKTVANRKKAVK